MPRKISLFEPMGQENLVDFIRYRSRSFCSRRGQTNRRQFSDIGLSVIKGSREKPTPTKVYLPIVSLRCRHLMLYTYSIIDWSKIFFFQGKVFIPVVETRIL